MGFSRLLPGTRRLQVASAAVVIAAFAGAGHSMAVHATSPALPVHVSGVTPGVLEGQGFVLTDPGVIGSNVSTSAAIGAIYATAGGTAFPIVSAQLADVSNPQHYSRSGGHVCLCWVVVGQLEQTSHNGQKASTTVFFVDAASGRFLFGSTGSGF
jgi:hypothetical protein